MSTHDSQLARTSTDAPPSHSAPARKIAYRTKGHRRGFVTRLMSPGDVGELVKPFVFLDRVDVDRFTGPGFAAHPHSGIATHTTLLDGRFDYGDSTGKVGSMPKGSLEWMQAGRGVWHWGSPKEGDAVRGYQLWIALPKKLELAPARSQYIEEETIPSDGPARVLLGTYGAMSSPILYDEPIAYLHVRLNANEAWTFAPPTGHDVAWLAVHQGTLTTGGEAIEREMVVFEEGSGSITLRAVTAAELVFGSAAKHPHPLVCGYYSVHTSPETLDRGEAEIASLAQSPGVVARRRSERG